MTNTASLVTADLGPFALGPKIGGGGMASVYLGKYVAAPGEEVPEDQEVVALKVIKGDFVKNPSYEQMFLDEAQILTQLSHPNVIRTLGYGAQAGAWFIAMELLMGRCLLDIWGAAHDKEIAIPLDAAAYIAREVARGLGHAHALVDEEDGRHLGIVHRDVNPSNVFIGYDATIKLIDFGLAKARKRQTQSTRGLIKGKIPYLSPEQIKEDNLDGRSDVYALGTTLWEMVTMRRLFKRDSDIDTVRAIQKGDVPDVRNVVHNFPEPLWKIIDRSLKQDRNERYASAEDMARDLDAYLGARAAAQPARIVALVEELFPGEAIKQSEWLDDATGRDPKTFVPPVALAEVPEVEQSVPALAPSEMKAEPEPEPEPETATETETEPETETETETETVPVAATGHVKEIVMYAVGGAIAGAVVIGIWIALR